VCGGATHHNHRHDDQHEGIPDDTRDPGSQHPSNIPAELELLGDATLAHALLAAAVEATTQARELGVCLGGPVGVFEVDAEEQQTAVSKREEEDADAEAERLRRAARGKAGPQHWGLVVGREHHRHSASTPVSVGGRELVGGCASAGGRDERIERRTGHAQIAV